MELVRVAARNPTTDVEFYSLTVTPVGETGMRYESSELRWAGPVDELMAQPSFTDEQRREIRKAVGSGREYVENGGSGRAWSIGPAN